LETKSKFEKIKRTARQSWHQNKRKMKKNRGSFKELKDGGRVFCNAYYYPWKHANGTGCLLLQ